MKRLAKFAPYMLAGALLGPIACWAGTWSACQTITSLTDYTSYNNSFYVNLSPGIPGCVADTNGAAIFRYVTPAPPGSLLTPIDIYKNLFATTALAYSLNKQVMIYYDNSQAPACVASIISIGGISNQCN